MQALEPFCKSDRQREILAAVIEHGSHRAASRALGCNKEVVNESMRRIKKYAALQGHGPEHGMTKVVPDWLVEPAGSAVDKYGLE